MPWTHTEYEGKLVDFSNTQDGTRTVLFSKYVSTSGSTMTKQAYRDFVLHVEFRTPNMPNATGQARGNRRLYSKTLRSADSRLLWSGAEEQRLWSHLPGQYDILFDAARFEAGKKVENARVTVIQNGVLIQDNVSIPSKTGSGQAEGPDPAPILLQDHGNEVNFRNIWVKAIE